MIFLITAQQRLLWLLGSGFWMLHICWKAGTCARGEEDTFHRWGQANSEHRNAGHLHTRIMLMISIVLWCCGREAHEPREKHQQQEVKKKLKKFYAVQAHVGYECMLSDFFVCYSFILTEKLYTFESDSFLSAQQWGDEVMMGLFVVLFEVCVFLCCLVLCVLHLQTKMCTYTVVADGFLTGWQSSTWHAKYKLWGLETV